MPEFSHTRPSQTLALIESSPLSPAAWEGLAESVRAENNSMSFRSLEVIIAGLKRLEESSEDEPPEAALARRLSGFSQAMFVRLASAYNSPTLLKEVGLIYLRDLGLPEVAQKHFERALLLGGPERELRPLTEAAAVAVQRQIALKTGAAPELSGLATATKKSPVATTIIRRTGRMLIPAPLEATSAVEPSTALEAVPETSAECLVEASRAIAAGRLARAEELLKKTAEKPGDVAATGQAWSALGNAAYEAHDYTRMERAFVEARKFAPHDLASHFNAALGFQLNGKNEDAVQAYAQANRLQDRHPKLLCNLGVLYFQMEAYPEAEKVLRDAVKIEPGYARAWDNLAAALGAQEKLEEAMDASREAVRLRPDYSEAHFKMGLIHFARREWDAAAQELEKGRASSALRGDCEALLALAYCRQDKIEAAQTAVHRAAEIRPRSELLWMAWNDLGLAQMAGDDSEAAARAFQAASECAPSEPGAWINLGLCRHRSDEKDAARTAFQRAVELDPSVEEGWHNLGTVCVELNDLPAAVSAFRQETTHAPDNVRAWHDLGVALKKMGQGDAAGEAFARAESLDLTPRNPAPEKQSHA